MWTLGPLGFTAPWLLLGLIALPILWILLRAVPPAPVRRRFPGVALLLGLTDDESQTDRTPWWLLLLRMLAVALVIAGFAGPVLNPQAERTGTGPLLILTDGTWADARDWDRRTDRIAAALDEASRGGRTAALVALTDLPPEGLTFQAADAVAQRLPALSPAPWEPDAEAALAWAESLEGSFDTFWLSDGLAREGRDSLLATLEQRGTVTVFEKPPPRFPRPSFGPPPSFEDGTSTVARSLRAQFRGGAGPFANSPPWALTPLGAPIKRRPCHRHRRVRKSGRPLATEVQLVSCPRTAQPPVTRFEIEGLRPPPVSVALTDDALQRPRGGGFIRMAAEDRARGLENCSIAPLPSTRTLAPTADT